MSDRYWVGGTGNWSDDDNHWATSSGGAPANGNLPTASDNVIFDTLSNSTDTAYTMTIDTSAVCLDFTMDGPGSGANITWAGSSALAISGTLNLIGGSTDITRTYTGTITFNATSTGKTLDFNGLVMSNAVIFAGVGGGWTLNDAMNLGSNILTLSNGTLDTNGQTVTILGFTSNSGATRALTLGTSTITMTGQWFVTASGFTLTANTSTITSSANSVFVGGGLTYYNVTLTGTQTSENAIGVSGANTFNNLTRTNASGYTVMTFDNNVTVNGTFTVTGNNANTQRIYVKSDTRGTTRTITAAAVSLTNADFEDITGAGAASWTGTSLGDVGGNSGITFTGATTRYWIGGTGNWSATAEWSASSGGGGGASMPLPQDDVVFDANSFSAGSQTVSIDVAALRLGKSINWTGVTNTPTMSFATNASRICGSLTFVSGMNVSGSANTRFLGRGSFTITSAGKSFAQTFLIDAPNGTYTLQDAWLGTGTLQVLFGTFDANDQSVTGVDFISTGTGTRVLTMGNGTWILSGNVANIWNTTSTGITLNPEGSTIKLTGVLTAARNFVGSGLTYNNFWNATTGAFAIVITGSNTFNDFKIDAGRVQHFTAATTTTVTSFTATGSSGNTITITSATAASHALVKSGGGKVCCNYLVLSRSDATPANTWYAGANSTDSGNNSGWLFQSCSTGICNLPLLGVS